ncbi:electron transporter protein SCO1/SenC [Neobacillus bataviensis LMG 21833]|uniref:Electron transporter protein SCO1/SenC n=1 Tax=Neobacillus bataviensis LMG 21833 TaxID=1117379 RepID=K6DBV5_9BACI|nr:SCO family protein [Neobacillus bataviensis]EKN65804.1 electron transporter protein SCO1/SenC [Neobacillus bataviensis LMG 21833]
MKKIYLICSLAVFLGIAGGISFFLIRDTNAAIPADVTLINQNGDPYQFGKDKTKLKLIEFIYTHCPDVCPTTTQKMVKLKNDLVEKGVFGKNIEFVTITIDPYRDTPEILQGYRQGFGIKDDKNWVFLTGEKQNMKNSQKEIRKVTDAMQFQYKDPGNGQFIHSTFTYLVDENNKFVAKFPMGNEFKEQEVYDKIIDKIK